MHVSVAHATCAGRICTFDTKTGTSCLQAQANASGSAEAMEVGRTVARIGEQANQQGRCTGAAASAAYRCSSRTRRVMPVYAIKRRSRLRTKSWRLTRVSAGSGSSARQQA